MLFNLYQLRRRATHRALLLSLVIFAHTSPADSYLADLEAEANSTDVQIDEERQHATSRTTPGKDETLRSGMSKGEFDQVLKENYYSHFIFYEKLSKWNQKQIYKRYTTDNDLESIRHEIIGRMPK